MAAQTFSVSSASVRPSSFLSHPLQSFSITLAAWNERRRNRAGARLLMSLEPHMLKDIGVILAEPRGTGAMLRWHPAVLATTMEPDTQPEATEF